MLKSSPVSVRLKPELNDQVAAIATAMDRSKSWVIEQAVQDYVELQAWQYAAIQEGVRAADEGRVVSDEKLVAWLESWGTDHELPPPECD